MTRQIELSAGTIEYEDTGGEGPAIVLLRRPHDGRLAVGGRDRRSVPRAPVRRTDAAARRASPRNARRRRSVAARARAARLRVPRPPRTGRRHARRQRHRRGARPAARRRRRHARRPDRARLLRRVRELPAGPDRQDAGADRQALADDVRAVHAADAPAAAQAAPPRLRLADHARRRRHRPLDQAGPARSARSAATPCACSAGSRHNEHLMLDAAERLPSFERPALVVWASQDRVMPPEHGRRLAELLPHGRLVEIPTATHSSPSTSRPGLPRPSSSSRTRRTQQCSDSDEKR